MASGKDKYKEWALRNKSKSDMTEDEKKQLELMEREEEKVKDSYKRMAEGWSDEKRDDFKREKSAKEGIDYMEDYHKLQDAIANGDAFVIASIGTTGLKGSTEEGFFNEKDSKNATRKADGTIEFGAENLKNCANDTITQVTFLYYEKGKDGFYHVSENPDLSLKIPLVRVAPAIIERAEERLQKAIEDGNKPYDVFKEGGIDVNDLKAKKGMRSDEVVDAINEYLEKPEIKNAKLVDFQGVVTRGNKKDFLTNFINHTYDWVNISKHTDFKFGREMDINLLAATNGYNLSSGNRRLFTGAVKLDTQVNGLQEFYGQDVTELKTSEQKAEGIGYLLNEFVLRDMLEKQSPETNLKIYEYCDLFSEVDKNVQKQTPENKEKLADLRNEIVADIEKMHEDMEYARSMEELGDAFPMYEEAQEFDENDMAFPDPETMMNMDDYIPEDIELDGGEITFDVEDYESREDAMNSLQMLRDDGMISEEAYNGYVIEIDETDWGKEEPEFTEEAEDLDDKAYEEAVSKTEEPMVETAEPKEVVVETKESANETKVVEEAPVLPTSSEEPKKDIPTENKSVTVESPDMRELMLMKRELELRSLEAELKLKEIELAKRELDLQSKQPEIVRLTQHNNFALMKTFCETLGNYLGNDRQGKKEITEVLKELADLKKEFDEKMNEIDPPKR